MSTEEYSAYGFATVVVRSRNFTEIASRGLAQRNVNLSLVVVRVRKPPGAGLEGIFRPVLGRHNEFPGHRRDFLNRILEAERWQFFEAPISLSASVTDAAVSTVSSILYSGESDSTVVALSAYATEANDLPITNTAIKTPSAIFRFMCSPDTW